MLKHIIITILLTSLIPFSGQAQTVSDALRYSLQNIMGTARNISTGGSMSGIGADFSAVGQNPAGVAAYWKSEFMFTPAMISTKTDSRLEGQANEQYSESLNKLAIANLGFVITSRPRSSKWLTSNFAIGFNRTADYNQEFYFQGNTLGSITDRFLELAYGQSTDNLSLFEEGLAFEAGAIYDFNDDRIYESDYITNPNHPLFKEQFVSTEGSQTELSFSYGANLQEKLLIGFGVAVPIFNFHEEKIYTEEDEPTDEVPYFNSLNYEENLTTSGYGFQFKLGAIYKPVRTVGIGFSFHTPASYNLTDDYYSVMEYSYTDDETHEFEKQSPDGSFNYKLKTPWKIVGSLGFVIQQSGFLSAEVQWIDYSSTEFDYTARGNGNAFIEQQRDVNRQISNQLSEAISFKIGGEYARDIFRARAGVALTQSPYTNDNGFDPSYSAGIGVREEAFYIDLALRIDHTEEGYYPYLTADAPEQFVANDVRNLGIFITTGFKF